MTASWRTWRTWATAIPDAVTRWAGATATAVAVLGVVVALIVVGILGRFPPWWQTTVYAGGALVSVVMLFVLQHTTNRQTNAILVKLDELIIATTGAHEEVIDVEELALADQERVHDRLHHRSHPGA
ncbi:low affinity iron permease family protein [Mycolicibacterium sp. CBMA 226]|uniref:low affinity iron permease family protein n=1 Tax=Mycolicibacterium sp. CBMA 226 TaxID=2606611 RepID=UPI0012DF9966|nr:low affinity iron permease family protein [Mycolicibacterium sp. CBMA 226]MUL77250.1 low affinity iron permease family protein [Mycolicibacterium sp. CBMA 226]